MCDFTFIHCADLHLGSRFWGLNRKDPELAKSLVLNMKDPEPAKAPEPAKRPGEVPTAATRILANRAPVGPGAGMTKEQAREKLASLPHAEQAEFYRQNAALIDG